MVQIMPVAGWPSNSEHAMDVLLHLVNVTPRSIEPSDPAYGATVLGLVPTAMHFLEAGSIVFDGDSSIYDLAVKLAEANGVDTRLWRGTLQLIREAERAIRQEGDTIPFQPNGMQLSICDALASHSGGLNRTELAGEIANGNRHAIRAPVAELQEQGWLAAPRARPVRLTDKGRASLAAHNKP